MEGMFPEQLADVYHFRLFLHRHFERDIQVNWKPASKHLHYQELYRGVYEFLREPPTRRHFARAVRYIRALKKCYHPGNVLQYHRIQWTQAWLDALDDPADSGDDTDVGESA